MSDFMRWYVPVCRLMLDIKAGGGAGRAVVACSRVNMRVVVLWGLLVLLQLQTLVGGHALGRPASSASELDQLQVQTGAYTL